MELKIILYGIGRGLKITQPSIEDKLFNSLQIDPIESFKEMNFIPPYSIDYGIKKTVSWYLKNQNKY